MYHQFVVHLSYATDRPGLLVGCPASTLAYFVSGFFYMVGLRLCEALSRCHHFWDNMTSQCVIDLYHFPFGSTNSCNIIVIAPCSGNWSCCQEAWKLCLVLALDHNNVNWWWCLYDFKGHSSASNHSQTVRYSKIPVTLAKKGPL